MLLPFAAICPSNPSCEPYGRASGLERTHLRSCMLIARDSLHIRRSAIAYVFNQPLELQPSDYLAFFNELAKGLPPYPETKHDPQALIFQRRTPPDQLAEIWINRVTANAVGGIPVPLGTRLLIAEAGASKPVATFAGEADAAYEAFQQTFGNRAGRLQVTEVSFEATLATQHNGGSIGFIAERLLASAKDVGHLGRQFMGSSIKLQSPVSVQVGPTTPSDSTLPGTEVEIVIEPFNADMRLLFFRSTFKWPALQVNLRDIAIPPEVRAALSGSSFVEMNQEALEPSHYVKLAFSYVEGNVLPYLMSLAR